MSDGDGDGDNDNRSMATAGDGDDNAGQNNNVDRIAAVREKIALAEEEIEGKKEYLKKLVGDPRDVNKDEQIVLLKMILKDGKLLQALQEEFKDGKYFAKTEDIFPLHKCPVSLVETFKGAADKMTRDNSSGLYEKEVEALIKHLPDHDGENTSVADMDFLAPSEASDSGVSVTDSQLSPSAKTKNLVGNHTARQGKSPKPTNLKACIIPGSNGRKAHQASAAPTCSPWWPLVCLWAIGKLERLTGVYEAIEAEKVSEKRQKLESTLKDALVQLATGTSQSRGMRSSDRNVLYVPDPHVEYFDTGYNWIIVPIMTLEDMKNWAGEEYDVAIFVGEHMLKKWRDPKMKNITISRTDPQSIPQLTLRSISLESRTKKISKSVVKTTFSLLRMC
jgi:hypothetical protein